MARKKQHKPKPIPVNQPDPTIETVTLSVRLSESQHDILKKAADSKGWTPTSLLRTAALERAAHIINTLERQPEYVSLALRIADSLCEPTVRVQGDYAWEVATLVNPLDPLLGDGPFATIDPPPWSAADVERIATLAKFGGADFLHIIVLALKASLSGSEGLPPQVDPSGL